MLRYCANCGTEVDERAVFCPTCGQPIEEEVEVAMPPAPEWPSDGPRSPAPRQAQPECVPPPAPEPRPEPPPADVAPAASPEPSTVPRPSTEVEPRPVAPERPSPAAELQVTWPVTLSGWLIGIGAFVGALAIFLPWLPRGAGGFGGFDSAVNIIALIALLAISASVFFAARMPAIPHRRLGVLVVVSIGLGIGLDRIGTGPSGVGATLFLLAMLAAIIGALLVELGADRPLGGRQG